MEQFDPFNDATDINKTNQMTFHSGLEPSTSEIIPKNHVNSALRNIQTTYGISSRLNAKPAHSNLPNAHASSSTNNMYPHQSIPDTNQSNLIDFE